MALERSRLPTIHHEKTSESDTDSETPLQSHLKNALSLATSPIPLKQEIVMLPCYKECLKNHAASFGGLALDGCGEFMPSPTATSHDPASLKCAACGCHRSFHRRETTQGVPVPVPQWCSNSSPSLSPVASPTPHHSIFPSAPHMLLSLSTGPSWTPLEENHCHKTNLSMTPQSKKRARTKFTEEQKEKMHAFAEQIGWRIPRGNDEKLVQEFCSEVGVNKNVFKIWMHNNKNRRDKATDHHSSYDINNSNVSDNYEKYQLETKQVHVANGSPTRSS